MAGHAAGAGEDADGHVHALDVFGVGFLADEQHRSFARLGVRDDRLGRRERSLPTAAPGQAAIPLGDRPSTLRLRVELRQQQLGEVAGGDPQHGRLLVDQLLLDHVAGDLHRRGAGPLAVAGLQHVQRAVLDRELDVLHVAVVLLERCP